MRSDPAPTVTELEDAARPAVGDDEEVAP